MNQQIDQRLKRITLILLFVILLNLIDAAVLYSQSGSPFGWVSISLGEDRPVGLNEWLAICQFLLFGLLLDVSFRRSIVKFNLRYRSVRIPRTVSQVVSILVYGFCGLTGYILLFEHSINTLIAASGAVGLGLSYVLRDWIAGVQAGVQIQFDRLFGIGDWIQIQAKRGDKLPEVLEVVQIDRRMVTLKNHDDQTFQVPSVEFINGHLINFTRQKIGQRRMAEIQIDAKYEAQRILSILDLAVQYLIRTNPDWHPFYQSKISGVSPGHIGYLIKYEVAPSVSPTESRGLILKTVLRFMAAASINLESSVHVDRAVDPYDNNTRRLLEIRDQGILRALRFDEIIRLASHVRRREFRKDDRLIELDAPGDSMYFLSEGAIHAHVPDDGGQRTVLGDLWPGDCFGEMSLLTGAPRSADVTALTDGVVLEIAKQDLAPLLESNPDLAHALAEVLELRSQENAERKSGQKTLNEKTRSQNSLFHKIMHHFGLSA